MDKSFWLAQIYLALIGACLFNMQARKIKLKSEENK